MVLQGMEQIMSSWFGFTGSYVLIALGVIAFFILAFLIIGLDFRFALLFSMPLFVAFGEEGWLGATAWVKVLVWFIAVGLSIFLIWSMFSDR